MIRVLFLITLCVATLSCQRKPQTSPLGPPTSLAAIDRAQEKSLSKLDPYSIQDGQSVHKIETIEVVTPQGPMRSLSKEWITSVVGVENSINNRTIVTNKKVIDKFWDEDFTYQFKSVYYLDQVSNMNLIDQLNAKTYEAGTIVDQLKQANSLREDQIEGVAFHNLAVRQVALNLPELVKQKPGCLGFANCQIRSDLITYDIVFLIADGTTRTNSVEWYISSEVPFFSGVIKQCASTFMPVESVRVLVKQCVEVVDFNL